MRLNTPEARELVRVCRSIRQTTERRDELIRELRAQGFTLRAIADLTDGQLTHAGVKYIADQRVTG